jgi:hypothetical protein
MRVPIEVQSMSFYHALGARGGIAVEALSYTGLGAAEVIAFFQFT